MAITTIKEIRILPPLAIGRFGSSPEPLENFSVQVVDPVGFRKVVPAPSLVVDATGAVTETMPDPKGTVNFRDAKGLIKPLAPFLEVWARFEDGGAFEPLTKNHLSDLKLKPSDLRWSVEVANIKVFRRTGDANDKVQARLQILFDDTDPDALHRAQPLMGQCKNFKPSDAGPKAIPLGSVRYVRPTDAFPEIRFRFTPAAGRVYGTRAGDSLIVDDVYAGVTSVPAPPNGPWSVPFSGSWDRYWIGAPNSPPVTAPGDIFQGHFVGATKVSDGYFDDTCDGIVRVQLRVGTTLLTGYARIMAGVPDFAPDSHHVRTIADDLEQMVFGPDVTAPTTPQEDAQMLAEVVDTIRRAYETVRLMNTVVQNGDQNVAGVARNGNNMPGQQTGYGRVFEPVYDTASGDAAYDHVLKVHQGVLKHALASKKLAGAFTRMDMVRPYQEIGDLRTEQRRRMPAMMRGSDGLELAVTRRQYAKLALAAGAPAVAAVAPVPARVARPRLTAIEVAVGRVGGPPKNPVELALARAARPAETPVLPARRVVPRTKSVRK